MVNTYTETAYPLEFRQKDAQILGEHLKLRHCVELIGMKRVGISNFLRFFLNHKDIAKQYINDKSNHLFIPVDLNDLVEIDIYPLWILVFKRLVDALDKLPNSSLTKKKVSGLFLSSIQSKDLFITFDNLRIALSEIAKLEIMPTIFLIRFDRLTEILTDELFANLQGLIDATGQRLSFVFTGTRPLDQLAEGILPKKSLVAITQPVFIKPANEADMRIIFNNFERRYNTKPSEEVLKKLIELSSGHVQYLHLCLININEEINKGNDNLVEYLRQPIFEEERITLQSEEIYQSLTRGEQKILKKISSKQKLDEEEKIASKYLWDTGIVQEGNIRIFSPLFEYYLNHNRKANASEESMDIEMTKKESQLFELLQSNLDQLCERDKIASMVWPEYEEIGISDWTIDRLISRLREKLKIQKSPYSIITVKTRGYKLIKS